MEKSDQDRITPPPVSQIGLPSIEDSAEPVVLLDDGYVIVSRRRLYALGITFITAIVASFAIGSLFGRGFWVGVSRQDEPVRIHGTVANDAGDAVRNAIVIALPFSIRPDAKLEFEDLTDDQDLTDHPTDARNWIESNGGITTSDVDGRYALELANSDDFFLFAVSTTSHGQQAPTIKTLAELGRYFLNGDLILESHAFYWKRHSPARGTGTDLILR